MTARAIIFGCEGLRLTQAERSFFSKADPWGFILFARNIDTPDQVRALTSEMRDSVGRDAPILVDQEGGRVERFVPPHWRTWLPALDQCTRLETTQKRADAMRLRAGIIAAELRDVGVDVNCAPILDLARDTTHPIIRNRCYGRNAAEVAQIGRAVAEGSLEQGVLPIIKHIPGQGLAQLDTHLELPRIEMSLDMLEADDFAPFIALNDLPLAMSTHVVFTALDEDKPATQSTPVMRYIREKIGFDGLLITDDLSMQALKGTPAERARDAIAAGCDMVLHCNGDGEEMRAALSETPELTGEAAKRAERALALRKTSLRADMLVLVEQFERLVSGDAVAG